MGLPPKVVIAALFKLNLHNFTRVCFSYLLVIFSMRECIFKRMPPFHLPVLPNVLYELVESSAQVCLIIVQNDGDAVSSFEGQTHVIW